MTLANEQRYFLEDLLPNKGTFREYARYRLNRVHLTHRRVVASTACALNLEIPVGGGAYISTREYTSAEVCFLLVSITNRTYVEAGARTSIVESTTTR